MSEKPAAEDALYRPNVGIMLVNPAGLVFVARRIDTPVEAWQMPQGGIDEGEEPWATAERELEEETGIPPHLVERITTHPDRLRYDLPAELQGKLWRGRWKGQRQKWFLMRFAGRDEEIDLATAHPEFDAWRWVEPNQVPEQIVPFKRDTYRAVLAEFAPLLEGWRR